MEATAGRDLVAALKAIRGGDNRKCPWKWIEAVADSPLAADDILNIPLYVREIRRIVAAVRAGEQDLDCCAISSQPKKRPRAPANAPALVYAQPGLDLTEAI